jgi:hypothetical protein
MELILLYHVNISECNSTVQNITTQKINMYILVRTKEIILNRAGQVLWLQYNCTTYNNTPA